MRAECQIFLPYLKEKIKGGGALAVPIVLFGNRNFDDALAELRDILAGDGFYPLAAGAFVGEHSFSRVLGAGRPDAADFAKADELAALIAERIANKRAWRRVCRHLQLFRAPRRRISTIRRATGTERQ